MGYHTIVAVFVLVGILKTFATPWQQRSRNSAPWNCGRISFTQKGHNTHIYNDEEVSKKCYNLRSANQTALMLKEDVQNCAYKVEAFPMNHCDDDRGKTEYLMNPGTRVVHLNKLPVCSFFIETMPRDGTYLVVKFRETGPGRTNYVYETGCYNICNGPSSFDYPDTVRLYHANGNIALGYSVQLFSSSRCHSDDKITNENHEDIMKENGAMDLTSITQQVAVLSYAFRHARD